MKGISEANYMLGIKILCDRLKRLICLSQETFIKKVLKRFQMQNYNPIDTLIIKGEFVSLDMTFKTLEKKKQMARIPYCKGFFTQTSFISLIKSSLQSSIVQDVKLEGQKHN